jgi:hypothetical protein
MAATVGCKEKLGMRYTNGMFVGYTRYICRLTDEYTAMYICQVTDKCTKLCSSVEIIFLGSGTEEYIYSTVWSNMKAPRNVPCFAVVYHQRRQR